MQQRLTEQRKDVSWKKYDHKALKNFGLQEKTETSHM